MRIGWPGGMCSRICRSRVIAASAVGAPKFGLRHHTVMPLDCAVLAALLAICSALRTVVDLNLDVKARVPRRSSAAFSMR
jgi:hypothetical protein